MTVARYAAQSVLVANVEEARFDALLVEEGKTLVRARYAVRNNQRAFLALTYSGLTSLALTAIVVGRDLVIVAGAVTYQLLIAPVQGEPAAISKLNTACQLGFVFFTMVAAAFGWPPRISLTALGAAVVFTSIVSGLNYVLRWSRRAWVVAHTRG